MNTEFKTGIAPEALQSILNSAGNAVRKGQAQFFTPLKFAGQLAAHLPTHRPIIVDLTCGNGQFLDGASNRSTRALLGIDIDPCHLKVRQPPPTPTPKKWGRKRLSGMRRHCWTLW